LVGVLVIIGIFSYIKFNPILENKPQENTNQNKPQKLYSEDIEPGSTLDKPFNFYILKQLAGGIYLFELSKTRSYPLNYRQVTTKDGDKQINVVEGYRAIYRSPARDYFAKTHVDKSEAKNYEKYTLLTIDEIKYATHGNESLVNKSSYQGYEYYSREASSVSKTEILSQALIFSQKDQIIVTIYFLVPDPKAENFGIPDLDKHRQQQERFIHEIIDSVKAGKA